MVVIASWALFSGLRYVLSVAGGGIEPLEQDPQYDLHLRLDNSFFVVCEGVSYAW